ncbi:hypothetical protein E2C01_018083 [Portunus trituberculatus]|uniref:Uncharacterized protein n=1 Tax=Portunus trituberculatus TaxID=210409 RepID=A0A5B7DU66_PORTR|nr:hypothetical protein [Portunus trituberculatus]
MIFLIKLLALSIQRRPTLQEVNRSRRDATKRLTSDLPKISDWGRESLIKLSSVQCLKNSIPPAINSTQTSRQLSPLLQ